MKLLFILPEYPPEYGGGIGTFYGALLPALVEQGHHVTVVVGSAFVSGGEPYVREGVRVHPFPGANLQEELRRFDRFAAAPELQRHLATAWAIRREVGDREFDLVEATDWGLLFVPWVLDAGPRVVVRLHGSCGQIARWDPAPGEELQGDLEGLLEASVLRYAHAVATYSRANAVEWERALGRPVCLQPPPMRASGDFDPVTNSGRGFVAGRLQYWKGPHVVCEALRRLGPQAPMIEWAGRAVPHHASGQSYDRYLAKTFPDIWGSRLIALGRITPDQILQRQRAAAFVIVPSVWDMFNLTAPEAMAQGAILLCSEGAGAVDLVENGVNGFSFPASDHAALADLIRRALTLDETDRRAMRRAARETIRNLDPGRIAIAVTAHYQRVMSSPQPQASDEWTRRMGSPGREIDRLGFLDRLPLKAIVKYTLRRSMSKARESAGLSAGQA